MTKMLLLGVVFLLVVSMVRTIDMIFDSFKLQVLANLQTTIRLSPTASVQCVQQLLKCLFGMNLINQMNEMDIQYCLDKPFGRSNEKGFYEQCFQKPAKLMTETIKAVSNNCRGGSESDTG